MHDMNDKMNHQDFKSLTQFMTLSHDQTLKKNIIIIITNLLVSVSVFSFMISNSAWGSFFHHLNFYVVALPLQLLSHALGKGYIFLICNGILLIIAKTSSLVYPNPPSNPDFDDGLQPSSQSLVGSAYKPEESASRKNQDEHEKQKKEEVDEDLKEKQVENGSLSNVLEEADDKIKLEPSENDDEVFKEEHIATYILGDDYKVEKDLDDNDLCIIEEDDEENDENYENALVAEEDVCEGEEEAAEEEKEEEEKELKEMESMSTEELNKKFEDFIRRMKQELRIEAQQQLVAVK